MGAASKTITVVQYSPYLYISPLCLILCAMAALIKSWEFKAGDSDTKQEYPFMFDSTWDAMRVLDFLEQHRGDVDVKVAQCWCLV